MTVLPVDDVVFYVIIIMSLLNHYVLFHLEITQHPIGIPVFDRRGKNSRVQGRQAIIQSFVIVYFKSGQIMVLAQSITNHITQAKKNKQGKLEHIEDNGFIFKKINKN